MKEALDTLKARVIRDVDGMPWKDKGIPRDQLLNSVKYFINAYTNDVEQLIGERLNAKKTMDRSREESIRRENESSQSSEEK